MRGDLKFRILNVVHQFILKATRGRFGWRLLGMEVVALTTTGRKSGEQRTVLLTSPMKDGDRIVVVASRGGDTKHPAWYLNIEADPKVGVSRRRKPAVPMTARVAEPDERARLWPTIIKKYKPYAGYQERAGREIPVVLLEPVGS